MDTLLAISAILCSIIGLLGAVVPVLPGTIISFAGLLCAYFTTASEITTFQLWLWGAISIIVIIFDYVLPAYFSHLFGGTKAGSIGATIGVIAGMILLGPIGIILGPFAGAVIGELIGKKHTLRKAIVVGVGSLLSFIVGTEMKLIAGGFMLYYIWADVF